MNPLNPPCQGEERRRPRSVSTYDLRVIALTVGQFVVTMIKMEVGLIGAGKIGSGLMRRWRAAGHDVLVFDKEENTRAVAEEAGAKFAVSLSDLVHEMEAPRLIWVMIPAGRAVEEVTIELAQLLDADDVIVDGGNSYFKDSVKRAERLSKRGIGFIDVGTSGGVGGEKTGYAFMVGGEDRYVERLKPLLEAGSLPDGYAHVGPVGSGHFVKMVHNAIEYGVMQAMGEGFDLLKHGPFSDIDAAQVANLWSHGTIVRSFLMELAARALEENSDLAGIAGYVEDSGEGRWSVQTAVENAVPFWVNTAALYARFNSRQTDTFSAKLVAALRKEFGGHAVKKEDS